MFLSPLLCLQLRPRIFCWITQARSIRPTIKVGKDKFQLSIDLRNFKRDEITVKARPEYLIIEGKQEKKTKGGFVMRQFVRKFKLPAGVSPYKMKSDLSADGVLTVTAPRKVCEANLPCESVIPITFVESKKGKVENSVAPTDKKKEDTPTDPCGPIKKL